MRHPQRFVAFILAASIPLTAAAYTHGKPGLWQANTQMSFAKGGPPPIPPDRLAMMEKMGIKMPGSGPITANFCVTPEQANSDHPPAPQQRGDCEMQNLAHDGHTFTADMVCTGEMKGTGHMSVTYDSDEHYAGTMHFAGTSPHGDVDMTNQFSGQWQADDCGAVKPLPNK